MPHMMAHHRAQEAIVSTTSIVEQLVGVRFAVDVQTLTANPDAVVGQLALRPGPAGTLVADAPVISGPVFLLAEGSGHTAWCRGCGETSRRYKTRVRALEAWADAHYCAPMVVGG